MYSRYHNRSDRPLRLPENYGGSAFSTDQGKGTGTPGQISVAKPTPPPEHAPSSGMPPPPRPVLIPPSREESALLGKKDDSPPPPKPPASPQKHDTHALDPLKGLLGGLGHSFPFAHGIGFDELLILGLILLLSRNEADSDLILWLALLLFCG